MGILVKSSGVLAICLGCTAAFGTIVIDYETFDEGLLAAQTFTHQGVTYRDINNVSGHWPSGAKFDVDEVFRRNLIIEDASQLYNDFPSFGSPTKALTLGNAYIQGPGLTIGPLASLWMDLDQLHSAAALDVGYLENGPWGGIEYRFDALLDDVVVASDLFVISDEGGRDNPAIATLSVDGAQFDRLHLYAWYNGMYSKPRGIFDNLTLTPVPEPASILLLGLVGAAICRCRR